jgi:hypothetical protein
LTGLCRFNCRICFAPQLQQISDQGSRSARFDQDQKLDPIHLSRRFFFLCCSITARIFVIFCIGAWSIFSDGGRRWNLFTKLAASPLRDHRYGMRLIYTRCSSGGLGRSGQRVGGIAELQDYPSALLAMRTLVRLPASAETEIESPPAPVAGIGNRSDADFVCRKALQCLACQAISKPLTMF